MKYTTAYSTKNTIEDAVKDLQNQLADSQATLILFFASSHFEPHSLSTEMNKAFSKAAVIGSTTAGEIVTGKMLDNSIVAMAFDNHIIEDFKIEVLSDIKNDDKAVSKAFKSFEKHFNQSMSDIDYSSYVGLVFTDGLSGCEEKVMDKIGDLTHVTFIGGSAGDDLKFKATYVYANGKAYTNASVLALLKPAVEFSILKTQSFSATNKVLLATKTNEAERKVLEFNHKPASLAYAEALGVMEKELPDHIFKNPLGLMAEAGEPFVRSPRVIEDRSMFFYCSMLEGMEFNLLNSTDIITNTRKALEQKRKEMGHISAIINFNCILRTLDLKQQNLTQEYGDLFKDVPTIGFSTYGESLIGHINQTATMLIFK